MLSEILPQLPPSENKIAAYILENPEDAVTSTASELGQKSATSSAAVIRLCKSLGLRGFQELKLRVAGDLQQNPEEGYRDIQANETQDSVVSKMTNNSIQAIKETTEIIQSDTLNTAVSSLLQARNIHFFGVGASGIIAQDAQQKFVRINKSATAFTDVHMAATVVSNLNEEDVVVGISHSGQTEEVAQILELAKDKGAKTMAITRYGSSPVSNMAEIVLNTSPSKEATFRSGATSSRLAQLHIIDILFICVATQQYEESIYYLDQSREAVKKLKRR